MAGACVCAYLHPRRTELPPNDRVVQLWWHTISVQKVVAIIRALIVVNDALGNAKFLYL